MEELEFLRTQARDWFERVWNQRDDAAITELVTEDAVGYMESGAQFYSIAAFKQFRDNVIAALPDLRFEVEAIIAQPPDVVVRWVIRGTHTGNGFGFPPTASKISIRGMTWLRSENGKFVEGWDCWNQTRMMQTLVGSNVPDFGANI